MIYAEYLNVNVDGVFVHEIGNKLRDEGAGISDMPLLLDDIQRQFLLNRTLSCVGKCEAQYQLYNSVSLSLNIVYCIVHKLFNGVYQMKEASMDISRHLYDSSCHPCYAGGNIYFMYLKDAILDGETCDALAIFKSAPKIYSMNITKGDNTQIFNMIQSVNDFESGAIIFNTEQQSGYRVAAFDKSRANGLWMSEFLGLQEVENERTYTRDLVNLTTGYIDDVITDRFEVSSVDKSLLMNKFRTVLENSDSYDTEEFDNAVFEQPDIIKHYQEYRQQYGKVYDKQLPEQFTLDYDVSKKAAKKIAKRLRLDENFYIYIHTDNDKLIEQGIDSDSGMNYMKLFYNNERTR